MGVLAQLSVSLLLGVVAVFCSAAFSASQPMPHNGAHSEAARRQMMPQYEQQQQSNGGAEPDSSYGDPSFEEWQKFQQFEQYKTQQQLQKQQFDQFQQYQQYQQFLHQQKGFAPSQPSSFVAPTAVPLPAIVVPRGAGQQQPSSTNDILGGAKAGGITIVTYTPITVQNPIQVSNGGLLGGRLGRKTLINNLQI